MSGSIDERLVALHFDNAQFEKGVKQSLESLEDLKEGLNFDGVGDSFTAISKASKQLSFKDPAKYAGVFQKTLTGVGKVAKGVFSTATFPFQTLGKGLNELGGRIRQVLGIDLASTVVNAGKAAIKQLSIEPIMSGWNEYEMKMDSIKTIMEGSGESLDVVKKYIEDLNRYADETIYSFQDMTSNIGKFTNNGVKLDDATKAMMGIANVAAKAGQGTQQASMAMYNFSQAMGLGYVELRDWRSIENANMATMEFKQTLIDVGKQLGVVTEKSGKFYVKNGKKQMEVTAENFRETLSAKWLTKDVLTTALKIYSGELDEISLMALGFSQEESKRMYEIGYAAKKAATEVRTFSKMWDALREAAQSGWGLSFEYIIGDLNEATGLWTAVNEKISDIINGQADARNEMLMQWRGLTKNEEGLTVRIEGAKDGRDDLIAGLNNLFDIAISISNSISQAWKDVFGEFTANDLLNLTEGFKNFTQSVKDSLGPLGQSDSTLSKISRVFRGLFSVIKIVVKAYQALFKIIKRVTEPVAGVLFDALIPVADWITGLAESLDSEEGFQKFFQKTSDDISNFFKNTKTWLASLSWKDVGGWFSKVSATLKTEWNKIVGVFSGWASGLNFDGILAWFSQFSSQLGQIWQEFASSDVGSGIINFFTDLYNSIAAFFTEVDASSGKTAFGVFIADTWETIKTFSETVSESTVVKTAEKFFSDLWTTISNFFTKTSDETGKTGFQQFVTDTWEQLQRFAESVQDNTIVQFASEFFSGLWETISNFFTEVDAVTGKTAFDVFVHDTWSSIQEFAQNVQNSTIVQQAKEFLDSFVGLMFDFIAPPAKAEDELGENGDLFDQFTPALEDSWNRNKETAGQVKDEFDSSVGGIVGTVSEFSKTITFADIRAWFDNVGAELTSAWESIKGSVQSISSSVAQTLDDARVAMGAFVTFVQETDWDSVFNTSVDVLLKVAKVMRSFNFAGLLGNLSNSVKNTSKIKEAFSGAISGLSDIFGKNTTSIAENLNSTVSNAGGALGDLFNSFKSTADTSKRLDAIGTVLLKFAASIGIVVGSIYALSEIVKSLSTDELANTMSIMGSIVLALGIFTAMSYKAGATSGKLGTSVLMFAVGLRLVIGAIGQIAKLGVGPLDSTVVVLGELTLLIAAFEALSKIGIKTNKGSFLSFGGKSSGLIGFVIAIEGLVLAIKQLADISSSGADIQYSVLILTELIGLITLFKDLTSIGIQTSKGGILSFGGKSSGLIGFVIAIEGLVLAIKQLSSLPVENIQRGVDTIGQLAVLIGAFKLVGELPQLFSSVTGKYGKTKSSGGLIGFIAAITALLTEVVIIGKLNQEEIANGLSVIDHLATIIGAFKALTVIDGIFGKATIGSKMSSLATLVVFVASIAALIYEIGELAKDSSASGEKLDAAKELLYSISVMLGAITASITVLGLLPWTTGIKAFANVISFLGLIGLALLGIGAAVEEWGDVDAIVSKIQTGGKIMSAVVGTLGQAVGALSGNATGEFEKDKLNLMTEGMAEAADIANTIDESGLEKLKTAVGSLKVISDNLPNDPTVFENWFNGKISLSQFAEHMTNLGNGLKNFSASLGDANLENVKTGSAAIGTLIQTVSTYEGTRDTQLNSLVEFLSLLGEADFWGTAIDNEGMMQFFSAIGGAMTSGFDTEGFSIDVSPVIDAIVLGLESNQDRITASIQGLIQNGLNASNLGTTTAEVDGVSLEGILGTIGDYASSYGLNFDSMALGDQLSSYIESAGGDAQAAVSGVLDQISGAFNGETFDMTWLETFIGDGIRQGASNTTGAVAQNMSSANATARGYRAQLQQAGYYNSLGLASGIRSGRSAAVSAMASVCAAVTQTARTSFAQASPSKVFAQIGAYNMEGLANGTTRSADVAISATNNVGDQVIESMRSSLAPVSELLAAGIDPNPVIRPVVDLTGVQEGVASMGGLFGRNYGVYTSVPSFSRNTYVPDAVRTPANVNASQAIAEINERLDRLNASVSNMKIVLDTGVLVGATVSEFDKALGAQTSRRGRGA